MKHTVSRLLLRNYPVDTAPERRIADLVYRFQKSKPMEYKTVYDISLLRNRRRVDLLSNQTVGFVPTMGALHEGHLSLIRQAARENTRVYVSIFVNPTQFGPNEDFDSYPRTWSADLAKLSALFKELEKQNYLGRLDTLFIPTRKEMYPRSRPTSEINGDGSFVTITPLSKILEGASRPVFFRGVATVCMKLLNIVQPERVYFGQKDIQQTVVIQRMVEDFHLNTEVRVVPTFREEDGLAMSSRNAYLGFRRRAIASVLWRALRAVQDALAIGKRTRKDLLGAAFEVTSSEQRVQRNLPPSERAMFEVEYISIANPKTMQEIDQVKAEKSAIVSGAIVMLPVLEPGEDENLGLGGGKTGVRLIDNIRLDILTAKMEVMDGRM